MRQSLPTPQCALIFTQEEEKKYEEEQAEEQAASEIELLIKDDEKLKAKLAAHPDLPPDVDDVIKKVIEKQKAAKEILMRVERAKEGTVEALEVEIQTLQADISDVMGDGRRVLQSLEIIDGQVLKGKRASYLHDRHQVVKARCPLGPR